MNDIFSNFFYFFSMPHFEAFGDHREVRIVCLQLFEGPFDLVLINQEITHRLVHRSAHSIGPKQIRQKFAHLFFRLLRMRTMGLGEHKNQSRNQSFKSVNKTITPTNTNDIVMFRGTQSGLEIQIDSDAAFENILLELLDKVETSGSFFSEAKTTVRFSKKPIPGILANLETIADKYNLTIVSIRSTGDEQKTNISWIKRINAISHKRQRERQSAVAASARPRRASLPPLRAKSQKRVSLRQRVA